MSSINRIDMICVEKKVEETNMSEEKKVPEEVSYKVGELLSCPRSGGGYHAWKVTGIYLGASIQESAVSLKPLDRDWSDEGPGLVPLEILQRARLQRV